MWPKKKEVGNEAPIKKTRSILRCPMCSSADIFYENALLTGYQYHCKKCGYVGALVLEEDYDIDEIEKDEEKEV